mgnify:CR=1 FL=1
MLLKHKTSIITGCNRGIGLHILETFVQNGANVFACYRKKSDQIIDNCKNLSNKLYEWTSKRWIISLRKSKGQISKKEENQINEKKIFDEVNNNLSVTKKIRKHYLIKNPFSIETSELTPTLKMKRRIIEKNYHKELKSLY